MKAAPFEYHAPTTVDEAVAVLGEHGDEAKVLAGGQSLVPMLALRLTRFGHLVDLNRIDELQHITPGDGSLAVGAMTRQSAAEYSADVTAAVPLLAHAIPNIGHFQIRNRGTIGGSISHADPASELPAVALALDAEIEVVGPNGTRRVPAAEFFVSTWETAVEPDEITVAVHFPDWGQRAGFALEEIAWRRGDFAIAGAACGIRTDAAGSVDRAAIAFLGMGPTPVRASEAEAALLGRSAADRDLDLAAVADLAVASTDPSDDIHASGAYRKRVAATLVGTALRRALDAAAGDA